MSFGAKCLFFVPIAGCGKNIVSAQVDFFSK